VHFPVLDGTGHLFVHISKQSVDSVVAIHSKPAGFILQQTQLGLWRTELELQQRLAWTPLIKSAAETDK